MYKSICIDHICKRRFVFMVVSVLNHHMGSKVQLQWSKDIIIWIALCTQSMCACVCLYIITKTEEKQHRALLSPKWKDNLHTSNALYSTFWWCVPSTLMFNHPMKVPTSN